MTITVLVPTYCRAQDLRRCLASLERQTRRPDEILVVVRDTDMEAVRLLEGYASGLPVLRMTSVTAPGQVAALNAGLNVAEGEVISFTDDDAAPRPDWLERIEAHFQSDARVGGVGGRDWRHFGKLMEQGAKTVVGVVRWYGRPIGNHHLGVGRSREVDHLKGANMSFRRAAINGIRFDERLRGIGAQFRNDMAFSMEVKQRGWKLIYDPAVAVDHFYAPRPDEAQRGQPDPQAIQDNAHNETLVLLEYLPPAKKAAFILWALLAGDIGKPGIAQIVRRLPYSREELWLRLRAAYRGRWEGWRTWRSPNR